MRKAADDPLLQILADVSADAERPLASGSTLARFQYAYTCRQAELPREERPAVLEMRAAQTRRIQLLNDYLADFSMQAPDESAKKPAASDPGGG